MPRAPQLLESDIQPSLTKLRKQCAEYNEYNALQSQRDRLLKFLCAYDHVESNKWVVSSGRDIGSAPVAGARKTIRPGFLLSLTF